jgi:carboxymethylenebutenolidase
MRTEALDIGYLAATDRGGGGVVVIHDVWGLKDHQRDIARRLAAEGFVALAVDLYAKLGSPEIRDPGAWMRSLSDADVLATIGRAVDYLRRDPSVGGRPVAVIGFCMGGMYAILAAAAVPSVAAVAPFYGILSHSHGLLHDPNGLDPRKKPREPLLAARDITRPILAFFGAEDPYIPRSDVGEFEENLPGPVKEVRVYDGAGHAFMNDTRPEMYRPDAARDAWGRLIDFLHEHCDSVGA